LLLLAQLQAVTGYLGSPRLAVLPRNEVALFNGALLGEATQSLQKQLLPFPAAQAADCISVSCQLLFSLRNSQLLNPNRSDPKPGPACLPPVRAAPKHDARNQTRRRFGGRQPLCGIGVTSRITTMCRPAAANARTADSRPEPGP